MQSARREVVHCGYLKKAPLENKSSLLWRNRWFVLLDSERVMADGSKLVRLEYYKDKDAWTNGKEYAGIIHFDTIKSISPGKRRKGDLHVMELLTNDRKYLLGTRDLDHYREWMTKLNNLLMDLRMGGFQQRYNVSATTRHITGSGGLSSSANPSKAVDDLLASTPDQQLAGVVPLRPTRASRYMKNSDDRRSGRRKSWTTSIWSSISKKFSSSSSTSPNAKNYDCQNFDFLNPVNDCVFDDDANHNKLPEERTRVNSSCKITPGSPANASPKLTSSQDSLRIQSENKKYVSRFATNSSSPADNRVSYSVITTESKCILHLQKYPYHLTPQMASRQASEDLSFWALKRASIRRSSEPYSRNNEDEIDPTNDRKKSIHKSQNLFVGSNIELNREIAHQRLKEFSKTMDLEWPFDKLSKR
ncbi:uncharacterized protein TRIADDRAFT_54324 [Trichoplax adhaerens]|uniref:PH domain-containing protein n=1 Tax=Trichoplax adhaerens TaxID=10228 RepID=B3RRQ3_TRIAD|nr:predicted protein [Trichoplax adhaerens]EDV26909.1 predicted protein [Trichoplax adhaerens]|eukprot:XP_002110905.1 predicted protein [Trichoplax adhaerens]